MKLYSEQLGDQLEKFEKEHGDYYELLNNYCKWRSIDDYTYSQYGQQSPSYETVRADSLLRKHTELVRCMVAAKMAEKKYEQINNNRNRLR